MVEGPRFPRETSDSSEEGECSLFESMNVYIIIHILIIEYFFVGQGEPKLTEEEQD